MTAATGEMWERRGLCKIPEEFGSGGVSKAGNAGLDGFSDTVIFDGLQTPLKVETLCELIVTLFVFDGCCGLFCSWNINRNK